MKKTLLLALAGIVFSCSKKDTPAPNPDPGDPAIPLRSVFHPYRRR